ncbi:hypothetical protein EV182_002298 [Spiromyces aspiralis]|uniref:Uncharacterized protein n=1 Tax=Spiromyces aspiralis TaxID=68401 RepID=A0ACC1HLX6_9FUNG|nr:hypothetical protein EV182_002298 [Spiromyces aspiralis]
MQHYGGERHLIRRSGSGISSYSDSTTNSGPPRMAPGSQLSLSESINSQASQPESSSGKSRGPTYEYGGFVLYLVSFVALGLFFAWAYLPDSVLHYVGITYYPDRYWALVVPAWTFTLIVFVYVFYQAFILYQTPQLDSHMLFTDEHYIGEDPLQAPAEFCEQRKGGIPGVRDVPISLVNECLYNG